MDELVYGVCKIQYTISCDVYELRVPKRDDDTYQATVFAFFGDGQVEKIESEVDDVCNKENRQKGDGRRKF